MTSPSRSDSSSPSNVPTTSLFLPPASPLPSTTSSPSSMSDPTTSTRATTSPTTELPTDDWSAGSPDDGTQSANDPAGPSSPPSTGELPKGSLGSRGELSGTVRAGVTAASSAAHELLADDTAKSLGAYLVDEDELDGIGDAAAGLLSRRVPAGAGSPDVTDLVKLGLILAGYVGRQIRIRRQVKALRAGALTAGPVNEDEPDTWGTDG